MPEVVWFDLEVKIKKWRVSDCDITFRGNS